MLPVAGTGVGFVPTGVRAALTGVTTFGWMYTELSQSLYPVAVTLKRRLPFATL